MAGSTVELVQMNDEELGSRLSESRRELLNLRFQLATGQLDNPSRIKQVRREVARVLTVLRERELVDVAELQGAASAPQAGAGDAAEDAEEEG